MKRKRSLVTLWSLLAVAASCSDSSDGAPETVAPADAPTTIVTTTTVPPPTTLPAPAVFLHSDGLGTLTFGAPYDGFSEGVPLEEDSDDGAKFPVDLGNGLFATDDGEMTFPHPRARVVCWNDGLDGVNGYLCAFFGGPDKDTLTFVGWSYFSRTGPGGLFSSHGVTANALANAVPAIAAPDDGCTTTSEVDGIAVDLVSDSGTPFGQSSADEFPADARVWRMRAGATFLASDFVC